MDDRPRPGWRGRGRRSGSGASSCPSPTGPSAPGTRPRRPPGRGSTRTGMMNSSRRYSLSTPRSSIEVVFAHRRLNLSVWSIRRRRRHWAIRDDLVVAQRLDRIEDDRLAVLQARLDAGQVVVRRWRPRPAACATTSPSPIDPDVIVPVLLEQGGLGHEQVGPSGVGAAAPTCWGGSGRSRPARGRACRRGRGSRPSPSPCRGCGRPSGGPAAGGPGTASTGPR